MWLGVGGEGGCRGECMCEGGCVKVGWGVGGVSVCK